MNTPAVSVMLVDDHTMLRQGLRRSLETEGITVVAEASNGDEAVRVALGDGTSNAAKVSACPSVIQSTNYRDTSQRNSGRPLWTT